MIRKYNLLYWIPLREIPTAAFSNGFLILPLCIKSSFPGELGTLLIWRSSEERTLHPLGRPSFPIRMLFPRPHAQAA